LSIVSTAFVPFAHERLDCESCCRRRRDQRQIAQAAHCHVERPWYRSRREREHIHFRAELLEALLVLHTKAVFLVDDHEAEIVEAHTGLEQAVCRDHDIDLPACKAVEDGIRLRAAAKA